MRTLLRNATIIDGTGAPPAISDLVCEAGRILDIGVGLDGDTAIELDGRWLLPGFIDCHVHVMVEAFRILDLIDTPFSLQFYVAARNLLRTLQGGVTTVRDMGGADLGVRRALEQGLIVGPRLQLSINLLSPTGGHADHWAPCGYAVPDLVAHPGRPDGVCDGAEVAKKTREMIRAGADVLKVCATGGVLSPGDEPLQPGFAPEELRTIVQIARSHGRSVAAHAHGGQGLQDALDAGVMTIEHGSVLDDQAIESMLKHDVTYIPTLSALAHVVEQDGYPEPQARQAREMIDTQRRSVARAIDAGVRVAMGTDAGVSRHGENLQEIELLRRCGMSAMESIRAATDYAARALNLSGEVGTLQDGKVADMVVLSHDPLDAATDLTDDELVVSVWQAGERVGCGGTDPAPLRPGVPTPRAGVLPVGARRPATSPPRAQDDRQVNT